MSIRAAALTATFAAFAPSAHAVVFYDGNVDASPTAHGLTYVPLGVATLTTSGNATTLNTSATPLTYAGLGTNAVPLDRGVGFTLRVDARLLAESHAADAARAGFSLLVVSSDLKAIEIGFHLAEVFSQAAVTSRSRGEVAAFDAGAAITAYDLVVLGDGYALQANGTPILAGALRDYTDFGGPPYTTPNSVFFGDDTTSGSATTRFSYASVTVPEPTSIGTVGAVALLVRSRRR